MKVTGPSTPGGVPWFPTEARSSAAPAAAAPPQDRVQLGRGRLRKLDTAPLFDTKEREPVDPALVTVWRYDAEDKHSLKATFRTPDGRTYVVADSFDTDRDRRKDPASYTAAFDAQGQPLWTWRPEGGQRITSHLFHSSGTLIVSRGDDGWDGSTLVSLNEHGAERWRYESPSREHIDSIRMGPDGKIYVKEGSRVVALSPDGKKAWSKDLDLHADEFFHVSGPDGTQYFATDNFSNNFGYDSFEAVTPDGQEKEPDWPDIGTFPLEVPTSATAGASPGSRLVYGGEKGEVHGLDLAGGKPWQVQTDSVRGLKTPWLGRDGNIYAEGRFDDKLYALSPDGKLLWSREIADRAPGGFDTPFQVDVDGSVYYHVERTDEIQRLLPDGRPGDRIRGGEDLESFRPGGDGKLYTWGRGGVVSVVDVESKHTFRLPLKMENPQVWDVKDVLPNGIVVLEDMCSQMLIQPSRDRELREALDRVVRGPEPEPGKDIAPGDGWIRIGDVRLPVNG